MMYLNICPTEKYQLKVECARNNLLVFLVLVLLIILFVTGPSNISVKTAPVTTSTPKPAESTLQSPQEVLRQAQTLLQTVSPKPSQVS